MTGEIVKLRLKGAGEGDFDRQGRWLARWRTPRLRRCPRVERERILADAFQLAQFFVEGVSRLRLQL